MIVETCATQPMLPKQNKKWTKIYSNPAIVTKYATATLTKTKPEKKPENKSVQ